MIKIFFLLLLSINIYAQEGKQKVTIGAGPYIQTQPYKGVDNILLPSPFFYYNDGQFYAKWTRFGVYFLGEKTQDFSWAFSLTAEPRVYGYKASDSLALSGMDDRKNSIEAGLAFSMQIDKVFVDAMLLTDVLYEQNAWIFQTEIGYELHLGKLELYPSLLATYQSSKFTDYYYGVKANEATLSRTQYNAKAGVQLGAQMYIKYPLTTRLATLINLHAEKLSSEAKNSPIVEDSAIYSGLVSLIYTFEY